MAKLKEKNPSQWPNSRMGILVIGQTQGKESQSLISHLLQRTLISDNFEEQFYYSLQC